MRHLDNSAATSCVAAAW